MVKKSLIIAGVTCLVFWVIVGIIALALAFSVLQIDQYGIVYDSSSETIQSGYYTSGIHAIGPFKSFIKFPRSIIMVKFSDQDQYAQSGSVQVWNTAGLLVKIDLQLFISLQPVIKSNLASMYLQVQNNWLAIVVRTTTASVKDVTSNFTLTGFVQNRTAISTAIQVDLQSRFALQLSGAVYVNEVQLQNIVFDAGIETQFLNISLITQSIATVPVQQQLQLDQKQVDQVLTQAAYNATNHTAPAQAQAQITQLLNQTQRFYTIMDGLSRSYNNLFTYIDTMYTNGSANTSLWNDNSKLRFIYANELSQVQSAQLIVGVQSPLFNKFQGSMDL